MRWISSGFPRQGCRKISKTKAPFPPSGLPLAAGVSGEERGPQQQQQPASQRAAPASRRMPSRRPRLCCGLAYPGSAGAPPGSALGLSRALLLLLLPALQIGDVWRPRSALNPCRCPWQSLASPTSTLSSPEKKKKTFASTRNQPRCVGTRARPSPPRAARPTSPHLPSSSVLLTANTGHCPRDTAEEAGLILLHTSPLESYNMTKV